MLKDSYVFVDRDPLERVRSDKDRARVRLDQEDKVGEGISGYWEQKVKRT